jgi:hypothetical protein
MTKINDKNKASHFIKTFIIVVFCGAGYTLLGSQKIVTTASVACEQKTKGPEIEISYSCNNKNSSKLQIKNKTDQNKTIIVQEKNNNPLANNPPTKVVLEEKEEIEIKLKNKPENLEIDTQNTK